MKLNNSGKSISYLLQGCYRQKLAHEVLISLDVFNQLKKYSPRLVGTIPLKIETDSSDLNLICEVDNFDIFETLLKQKYGDQAEFYLNEKAIHGINTIIAGFRYQDFMIKISGQPVPIECQHAYLHMLVKARLLKIGGCEAKKEIRRLKLNGMNTETAFARYFKLMGDPYSVLLQLARFTENELKGIIEMI